MQKKFYITTTAPYVNAAPHIGFAMEITRADTIARLKKIQGYDVIFGTGTDEHGQKIYQKANDEGMDTQKYCDLHAAKFDELKVLFNLSYTNFRRTTDPHHISAAQEFWRRCLKNGDIYKKNYSIKYCVGCELEKTDSELVENRCPLHPTLTLETIDEENYFFRFSKYQQKLLDFYKSNPNFVKPDYRQEEIVNFVSQGLNDFSISRLKSKMPWGIDVPDDEDQVMYVWFDALIFYISTLGWPDKTETFNDFWPGVQVAGKDNLRQQSAIWQAMLMSAGLPNTRQIFINGFINVNGQKMSKSLGNVVDPEREVKKYGTDAVRYYLLREITPHTDTDYSENRMKEIYNSELANELGNLVSRITTLGEKDGIILNSLPVADYKETAEFIDQYLFDRALSYIWDKIKALNKSINDFAPWNKPEEERQDFLTKSLIKINDIGQLLLPFLPKTGEQIVSATTGKIKKIPPLFIRLN